ncbi:MAG: type II toxin-antitoxin system HicA family toxin [Planctomycetaceae bacterium]|nr:type II toxin-antitoxin system HicA family toxin [Planctomycetaceae bacterium]
MSHHERTLKAIFADPIRANVRWADIEALFRHSGAQVMEREGSRVAVLLNDKVAIFHRPHPRPETGRATVRDVRTFLENAGVRP